MFDAACPSDGPVHQRAFGVLRVSFKRRGDATVLDGLRQEGCLKARFPRVSGAEWTTAVTLNTSGGIAAGDRLSTDIGVGSGASACVAAQAAERFYRAVPGGGPALVTTRISVADAGAMEWLPQETILFDHCALHRRLEIDLVEDAVFLGVESLVFGRAAMGERITAATLRDLIRVRRSGRLLLHDAIHLDGAVDATLRQRGTAAGAGALATIVYAATDADARLDPIRTVLSTCVDGLEAGASAWDGMVIVRLLAPNSAVLRHAVLAALSILRGNRPVPRTWMC